MDIDAREALVQALNNYEGAVLIVSHDPTMVERVADRLWLVKDNQVHPFEGDLEDYRKFTVQAKKDEKQKDNQKKKAKDKRLSADLSSVASATAEAPTKTEKRKANPKAAEKLEKDIARLHAEKAKLEAQMADPNFYVNISHLANTQKTYATLLKDLEIQESIWLEMQI